MGAREDWTIFTTDPRYRWRERILLAVFVIGVAALVWQREDLECRYLSWRLIAGVGEWDALFRLAEKGPAAMPYYVEYAQDPDPERRYKVILTLKAMRDDAARPILIAAMKDPDLDTRVNAFDAVAEIGAKVAIPDFIEALSDEEHRVRRVAHRSLHMLTGKTFEYEAEAEPKDREAAIERWESWWAAEASAEVPASRSDGI